MIMLLTPEQQVNLGLATAAIFLSVGFVWIIKKFGNVENSNIGPELNLLTYGYISDTIVKAINGDKYWHSFNGPLTRSWILFIITFLNLILLFWNLKLEQSNKTGTLEINKKKYLK